MMGSKNVKKRGSRCLGILLGILILLIFCFTGYIVYLLYGYHEAEVEYDIIREDYTDVQDDSSGSDDVLEESRFPDKDVDVDGLLSVNPDFVCWLYYPDGKVDLPVVKEHEDNVNEYLHKTFEGTRNSAGCVFMPYDADEKFHDLNTFLYGHNMRDGSMFGSLKYLRRDPQENFKDPYFYIWTKDHERMLFRVVAMYEADRDSEMYAVPMSTEGYREYLSQALSIGSVEGFVPFTQEEKVAMGHAKPLVTLSVCYGKAGTRNRLLIQGVELVREPF